MSKPLKRRLWIRILSFSATAFVLLTIFSIIGFSAATRYRTYLELGYRRALEEVSTYISNIENALNKGIYASTSPQIISLSNKLFSECACAQASLSQLPLDEVTTEGINKFIAQTGDFANTLSRKVASGEEITDEDYQTLSMLEGYAVELNAAIQDVESEYLGKFSDTKGIPFYFEQYSEEFESLARVSVNDGFRKMEEGFADYPTLIYDGPFSDHLLERESVTLKELSDVSENVAKEAAANFLRKPSDSFSLSNTTQGNLPFYTFTDGENSTYTVDVSVQGGIVVRMIDSRTIGNPSLSAEQAVSIAQVFLKERGFDSIQESYYAVSNGICTINFATVQEGYTCYPDLLKVGVALDNGSIVMYEASGYLMNHTVRDIPAPILSLEEAQEKLNSNLTVEDASPAVIPTSWKGESFCYEFHCTGKDGQEVLVYINTQTGLEDQILILEKSDNGTFVM